MCDRNSVGSIDIIHIDTEGFDYEILKLINFEYYKPFLLIYEHKHLSKIAQAAAQRLLGEQRYEVLEVNSSDTILVNLEAIANEHLLKKYGTLYLKKLV